MTLILNILNYRMVNKLIFLFSNKEKKQSFFLIVIIVINVIMELFGLALLIPTISLFFDEDYLNSSILLKNIKDLIESYNIDSLSFFLISIIIVFFFKSIIQFLVTYKQKKIVSDLNKNLSNRLFFAYLNQPYLYYTEKNRSKIIHYLQTEMNHFFLFFESLIGLIGEILIAGGMYFLILYVEPIGTLILTLIYLFASLIYFSFFNKKLKKWGAIRINLDQIFSKLILESIGGIKHIILNNLKDNISDFFKSQNKIKARYSSYHLTVAQLPRIYFELVAITSIISFIMILVLLGKENASLLVTITVFGAVSFKLLPSANKIISNYQTLKYYRSSLDNIYKEVDEMIIEKSDPIINVDNFIYVDKICVSNISFSYDNKIELINNLSFDIFKGEMIGISGKSGAGKSTLINILTGLIKPLSGNIQCDGRSIFENIIAWQSIIGYVPQSVFLTDDTIKKNIIYDDSDFNEVRLRDSLIKLDLSEWIDNLPDGIETLVGEEGIKISGGQKQRIGIAAALYKDPDILIFDESTNSLDNKTEKDILNSIKKLKGSKTIILVSHELSVLSKCDRIINL